MYFCEKLSVLSPKLAVSFCMPTSNEQEFLLLQILTSAWCCQDCIFWLFWEGYHCYLYDVKHLFICLFVISISLARRLLNCLVCFYNLVGCFLIVKFLEFFCKIFYNNSLLDVSFTNNFFLSCGLYFHSLDIDFCRAEVFHFNEVPLVNYFFHGLCLWCIWKGITIFKVIYFFLLCYLLGIL